MPLTDRGLVSQCCLSTTPIFVNFHFTISRPGYTSFYIFPRELAGDGPSNGKYYF